MSNPVRLYCWHFMAYPYAVHLEQARRVAGVIAQLHDQYTDEYAGAPFEPAAQA